MNIEDFRIDSVKILNNDVSIAYHTSIDNANRGYNKKTKELKPHPDFYARLAAFKADYLSIFGFKADIIEATIKGIAINEKAQIQIMGMINTRSNTPCNLNTPFVSLESEHLVSEAEALEANIESLRTEAWKYIWEQRSNQERIDFDQEEDTDDPPIEE